MRCRSTARSPILMKSHDIFQAVLRSQKGQKPASHASARGTLSSTPLSLDTASHLPASPLSLTMPYPQYQSLSTPASRGNTVRAQTQYTPLLILAGHMHMGVTNRPGTTPGYTPFDRCNVELVEDLSTHHTPCLYNRRQIRYSFMRSCTPASSSTPLV